MSTLKDKIRLVLKDFSAIKHKDRDSTVHVAESSPVYSTIQELHDDLMPNDWIFDRCLILLESCLDYDFDSLDDFQNQGYDHEIIDSNVDIFTNNLLEWAKTFRHWCDEAHEQGFYIDTASIEQRLMSGQYCQLSEMLNSLLSVINEIDSEDDDKHEIVLY